MELQSGRGFCMYILTTIENANKDALMEDLKKQEGVKSVNPVYVLAKPSFSDEFYMTGWDLWTIDIPGYNGNNPVKKTDYRDPRPFNRPYRVGTLPVVGTSLPSIGSDAVDYTGHFGGTSAACPQVAGVAALILSVNPNLTQLRVGSIIKSTARKARSGTYSYNTVPGFQDGKWDEKMGYGVVNAYAALTNAVCIKYFNNQQVTANTTISGCEIISGSVTVSNGATLTLQAPIVTINESFTVQSGSSLVIGP
jgi:subtilisin family serine protease